MSDAEGRFTLSGVKTGDILQISFIGYVTQEIRYQGQNELQISLREDSQALEEVVVVGYGVQKKVNLTGSVSSVKGESFERRPVVDATQSLQGLVPGLTVSNNNSGRPGASGTITLRGQGNLSNTANPYILVDGVEMSLADVNPNDIESISVLKDAAACAIYGARAAYGVILVTTKKGEEGKTRINYQGTVGWSTPTVLPDMVDSYQFAQYWNAGVANADSPRLYSEEKLSLLQQYVKDPSSINPWFELPADANMNPAFENSESGVGNTDYFDLHYKNWAFKQNHNISLRGGGKQAQYYVSGGYYDEQGILRYADIDYTRFNFAANLNSQLTDWLKLKVNTKFVHSDQTTPFGDGGLSEGFYHSLARFRPTVAAVDPNRHFTELTMIPYLQSGTYTDTRNNQLSLTLGADIQPLKNWFIFADYTYKLLNEEYEALNVAPQIYAADGVTSSLGVRDELGVSPDGKYTRSLGRIYSTGNITDDYRQLFQTTDLSNNPEVLWFKKYDGDQVGNSVNRYLNQGGGSVGVTASLVDDYLTREGRPFVGEARLEAKRHFGQELLPEVRDPRLAQTVCMPGQILRPDMGPYVVPPLIGSSAYNQNVTGYSLLKHVQIDYTGSLDAEYKGATPAIQFRYADLLLCYAEALAELDGAANASAIIEALQPLCDRVGMPAVDFDREYNQESDYPFRNLNKYVQAVRRERRVETACEGRRLIDILRWAAADELIVDQWATGALYVGSDLEDHPQYEGKLVHDQASGNNLYLSGQPGDALRYILPSNPEGYPNGWRFDTQRNYLLPIQQRMISLTGNLWTQNPGW